MDGSYNNPYKFNGKELDEDTGLYYYSARYYNPRLSVWYGVDPLAIYNPVTETQFYGDGQHNGGVYFWGNLNPYIYTYQNPINLIDPNGKQAASKAHRGGGYRGIGIPIPMFERGNIRTPFPVHTQEENREGFNKLGDDLKAATVMGLTAIAVSTSDVWVPLVDKYKQVADWPNRVLNADNSSGRERKVPIPGISGKDGSKDAPGWAKASGERPYVDENGKEFATRLMDEQYGKGEWNKSKADTGPRSEYQGIKKWGDRSFQNPPKKNK